MVTCCMAVHLLILWSYDAHDTDTYGLTLWLSEWEVLGIPYSDMSYSDIITCLCWQLKIDLVTGTGGYALLSRL